MQRYNVLMLGPRGSGKTVFLASLYHRLATQGEDTGFFLNIDRQRELVLRQTHKHVANPTLDWPDSTLWHQLPEWLFSARVETANGTFEAYELSYLDYAGERLTDPIPEGDEARDEEFKRHLNSAHALLGLLDGQKILQLMNDEPEGQDFINSDIHYMLSRMMQSKRPINFVISKWDLIDGRFDLAQVRDRLLQDQNLRNLITTRVHTNTKAVIRLIPVSAVGPNFVEPQPDGSMRKLLNGRLQPMNVEIPFASVLPDFFREVYDSLPERLRRELDRQIHPKTRLGASNRAQLASGRVVRLLRGPVLVAANMIFGPYSELFNAHRLDDFATWLEAGGKAKQKELAQELENIKTLQQEQQRFVEDEQSALRYTLGCAEDLLRRFEKHYPASNLTAFLEKAEL
jgi:GTPase SAR1 family protein